ncbi:MAG: DUF512 domain-containing protein [Vallitaleaceae bacterium]|nr:DUF512 domain-containing protein [Vallitaleaceae bacterium]
MKHIIKTIEDGSIAQELDIQAGDELISMNGKEIEDILDYRFLEKDEEIELVIYRSSTNEEWELFIEKEEWEEIGLIFDDGIMDDYKSCHNKCVFCFIDQLPKGMRETLYFKDDDARLSFLQGNYITLTNMKQKDFDRILEYKLSPINVSIHTMNMDLRVQMLKNRFADRLLNYLDQLYDQEIIMNGQIVLCKGINDGEELDYSIQEMMKYAPILQSVSIVPVGLTKFREHLEKLEPFTKEEAKEVLRMVEKYQGECMEKYGIHFIHAGDEFYFLAEEVLPKEETYDGYVQYENGVGMTRLLMDEFTDELEHVMTLINDMPHFKVVSLATGRLIAPVLQKLRKEFENRCQKEGKLFPKVNIYAIENEFFGKNITVSGLVTGGDIIEQLKDQEIGDVLYIPNNMLKSDEDVFLDDVTVSQVAQALKVQVIPVELSGFRLLECFSGKEKKDE